MKEKSDEMKHEEKKDATHVSHKASNKKKNPDEETVTFSKSTLWMLLTFVFAILFVVAIFTGGFGNKTTKSYYSDEQISTGVVNAINSLQAGLSPEVQTIEKMDDGSYKVDVSVQGQVITSFVSPGGDMFYPQGFPVVLEGAPEVQEVPITAGAGCGI